MRIVGGEWGGRTLFSPPGSTRPTLDRARQILFDIVGPMLGGGAVLDLYAGSGALGLEALSRGASEAVFVERSARVRTTLDRNVDVLGARDRSQVLGILVSAALPRLVTAGRRFRCIFSDPPYDSPDGPAVLHRLGRVAPNLLEPEGILVWEARSADPLPDRVEHLCRRRTRPVGGTALHFYALALAGAETKESE